MESATDVRSIVKDGVAATQVDDMLDWGVGAIKPQAAHSTTDDLIAVVLACLEDVTDAQTAYSACTDGRVPVRLLDGGDVPVREQMVGADTVSAFYVAETLGARFYKDPAAPVAERVREVVVFLKSNGIAPSSHVGCGAAAGFAAITENVIGFSKDARYIDRLQALLPADVYDTTLHETMVRANQDRLQRGLYDGLHADVFLQAVEDLSGRQAIAELKDDGRGVHGHVEEAIVRLRIPGKVLNEAKVAQLTGGREVFGVNDTRMERIARLFGRGADEDYRIAYMALEDFASCGHGTLAKGLSTFIITETSQA